MDLKYWYLPLKKNLPSLALLIFLTVNLTNQAFTQCSGLIYVTTTGSGTGSKASPTNLSNAITIAQSGTFIKMATGIYNISNALNIPTGVTFEGGYDAGSDWYKTSMPGATTITRTNANPEGAPNATRLVAFYGNNVTDFRFQDITITTSNANLPGMSTYGVHLTGCSNYNFIRTQIQPGDASAGDGDDNVTTYNSLWDGANGANGQNGTNGGGPECTCSLGVDNGGTGGNGGNAGVGGISSTPIGGSGTSGAAGSIGGDGRPDNLSLAGFSGTAGISTPTAIGGAGGIGGDQDSNGTSGSNVGNGSAGGSGTAGTAGTTNTGTQVAGFYVPGSGSNGTVGNGGAGGGGGGGAGRDTDACDAAGGGGSGGGGGGGGGGAGRGALGGGSSFGIYLFSNGTNGIIDQSLVIAGAAGAGGLGGKGGLGGNGGTSNIGNGCTNGDSDGNRGGKGGNGGNGGNGGDGGNGPAGMSIPVHFGSGSPLTTNVSNFNLLGQPAISASDIDCTNRDITFSAANAQNWDLGTGANPMSPSGSNVITQYNTIGRKDITYNGISYIGFKNISNDSPVPTITTTAPLVMGNYTVTSGSPINFSAGSSGQTYNWDMGGATTPNTYVGTGFENLNSIDFNTSGNFVISLFYTGCCGASTTATLNLTVVCSAYPDFTFTGADVSNSTDPTDPDNWLGGCVPPFNDPNVNITIQSGKTYMGNGTFSGDIINNGTLKGSFTLNGTLTNFGVFSPGN